MITVLNFQLRYDVYFFLKKKIYTGKMLWSSNLNMISVRELNLVGIYGSNLFY